MDQNIIQTVNIEIDRLKEYFSQIVLSYEKMKEMVYIDELTGLYNMRYFRHRLDEEIHRAKRHQRNFSIIILDVDNLREISDAMGNQAGNIFLRKIARCIKSSLRNIDIIAKYGGGDFVILLPDTQIDYAFSIAERIRENVENLQIMEDNQGSNIAVSVSGGIVYFDDLGKDGADFIELLDMLLLRIKKTKKDCLTCIKLSESA